MQVIPALSERLQIFESLREKQSNRKRAEATGAHLSIQLPDGRTIKGTAGVTTPLFVAQSARYIYSSYIISFLVILIQGNDSVSVFSVKGALVSTVNGELWELGRPLEADCELHLLGFDSVEGRQVITDWVVYFLL